MQEIVGGKTNTRLKNKIRSMEKLISEPFQDSRDRGTSTSSTSTGTCSTRRRMDSHAARLKTANFPASRIPQLQSYNIDASGPIRTGANQLSGYSHRSGKKMDEHSAGCVGISSDDEDMPDVPYSDVPFETQPILSSNICDPVGNKARATTRGNDWTAHESDDASDAEYHRPVTRSDACISEDNGRSSRDSHKTRRHQQYALDKEKFSNRPSKIVKLSVSPKDANRKILNTHDAVNVIPEFTRAKRVVAKDGFSQTRKSARIPWYFVGL